MSKYESPYNFLQRTKITYRYKFDSHLQAFLKTGVFSEYQKLEIHWL